MKKSYYTVGEGKKQCLITADIGIVEKHKCVPDIQRLAILMFGIVDRWEQISSVPESADDYNI